MNIRVATTRDMEDMHQLHMACIDLTLRKFYEEEAIDDWLQRCRTRGPQRYARIVESGHTLVAVADDKVVGMAAFESVPRCVELWYVHPDHQNKGVGSALLGQLESWIGDNYPGHVWTQASRDSHPRFRHHGYAVCYWKRCGVCERLPAAYMTKRIGP